MRSGIGVAVLAACYIYLPMTASIAQPLPAWAPKPIGSPPAETGKKKSTAGGKPPFEFRGHRVGELLDEAFPNWTAGKRTLFAPGCEKSSFTPGVIECDDVESFERRGSGFTATTQQVVGGVPVSLLKYGFYDGALYSVTMALHFRQYGEIHDMLVGRYGKPTRSTINKVQNRMGASFDNITSEWDFREGTMKIDMRAGAIDMSYLTFESTAAATKIRSDKATVAGQKGRSAF